jgi:HPt (histidine-containing phosphotransfer) domain-containing protein
MSEQGDHELDAFTERFRTRCADDLAVLASLTVTASDGPDAGQQETMIKVSHRIAGSGGIFGYAKLSADAFGLESLLIGESPAQPAEIHNALDTLIAELQKVISC